MSGNLLVLAGAEKGHCRRPEGRQALPIAFTSTTGRFHQEPRTGVVGDVALDLFPVILIGADAFAVAAYRQEPVEPI